MAKRPTGAGVLEHAILDTSGEAAPHDRLLRSEAVLAVVMPLHAPRLEWARRFLRSVGDCAVTRLGFFPVFSTLADLAHAQSTTVLDGVATLHTALAIIARPARINPVTSKKWLGVRFVFASSHIPYAMALDAEVAFAVRDPDLRTWLRAASTVPRPVFGTSEFAKPKWWPPLYSGRPILRATRESCALLGLSAAEALRLNHSGVLDTYWWFSDAPLYERSAFAAFWARLRWRPGEPLSWYAFDHVSYECHNLLEGTSRLINVDTTLDATSLVRASGTGDLCCGMEVASIDEQQALTVRCAQTSPTHPSPRTPHPPSRLSTSLPKSWLPLMPGFAPGLTVCYRTTRRSAHRRWLLSMGARGDAR